MRWSEPLFLRWKLTQRIRIDSAGKRRRSWISSSSYSRLAISGTFFRSIERVMQIRTIYHITPSIRWVFFLIKSSAEMLIILHPIDLADSNPSFKLVVDSNSVKFFFTVIALGSICPGSARLTSLLMVCD